MSFVFENLKVDFNRFNALDIDYLKIPESKTTWVVGPNGSGKTTFLKVLAGLIVPSKGTLAYNFRELITKKNYMQYRQKTTLLTQEPYLFRGTVLKNVMYGLQNQKFTKKESRIMAIKSMEQTGIADLAKRDSKHLSVGEKKRVALARCIATDSQTFLLDEPLTGLDDNSVSQITNLINKLSQLKKTLIISSHGFENIRDKKDLCIRLKSGKIETLEQK